MKIAIASGKGGTGKTTISTNLASWLSESEYVVLVDLDVEEPNSGLFVRGKLSGEYLQYKMIPEWKKEACTLCGECQEVCNYNAIIQLGQMIMVFPELCHSCYACSELCPVDALPMVQKEIGWIRTYQLNQLNFIESRLHIGEEQSTQLIAQTNTFVRDNYHENLPVIFDAPPGTSCPVIEATKHVDFVILVTEPTPFGVHDLKLAVETMRELKKPFGVVVNRFGIGNNEVFEYCENESIQILAKIPNSRKIAELYSRGELIYDKIPEFKSELMNLWIKVKKELHTQ